MIQRSVGIDDYLIILFGRIKAIAFVFVVVMSAFIIFSFVTPDRYEASNEMEVQDPNKDPIRKGIVRTLPFQRRLGLIKARLDKPLIQKKHACSTFHRYSFSSPSAFH